jgi:hypothetical protein
MSHTPQPLGKEKLVPGCVAGSRRDWCAAGEVGASEPDNDLDLIGRPATCCGWLVRLTSLPYTPQRDSAEDDAWDRLRRLGLELESYFEPHSERIAADKRSRRHAVRKACLP